MDKIRKRAIVFAYHDVGVRCLKVLLDGEVEVALVVTHQDNIDEPVWFESVSALCETEGIPCIAPGDACSPGLLARVQAARPALIFSFYYRHMLPQSILALAPAYNMHGSLLPAYRGRAPVNWAVLHGETETGATLHEMTATPDAGAIVARQMVPILSNDTAIDVCAKVAMAAELALYMVLPALLDGSAPRMPNDTARGSHFGRRKPEDGRIDWHWPASHIYNLHRALAPPYPGAFTELGPCRYVIEHARLGGQASDALALGLNVLGNAIIGVCGDGRTLLIHSLLVDGVRLGARELRVHLAQARIERVLMKNPL